MRHGPGAAARNVASGGLKAFARAGEGRTASTPALWARPRNATRRQAAPAGGAVGGGISQVLGGVARSIGRVSGKSESAIEEKENDVKGRSICVQHYSHRRRRDLERGSERVRAQQVLPEKANKQK